MPSSKSRQRELARAKYHRQMARKAATERRRRQLWASVSVGLAVVAIAVVAVWQLGGFERDKSSSSANACTWNTRPATDTVKDVGTPPTTDIPIAGTRPMNITFPEGLVQAELDLSKAPCTAASFAYLTGRGFFDNSKCHRVLDEGAFVMQCGDPSGTGSGGPAYAFADENLPDPPPPATGDPSANPTAPPARTVVYPRGTLAMANSGPGTNSSQFFIVYKDTSFEPNYTIFGYVTSGLDVIEKLAAQGTVPNDQGEKSKPSKDIVIQSLTVGEVRTGPAPDPTAPVTPLPTPTAAVPPTPSASPTQS